MQPLIVYKLGGSLLDLSGLAGALRALLGQRPETTPAIVTGGGAAANLVRGWQEVHGLGDEPAHWLALDAMAFNERLMLKLLPELHAVRSGPQLARARARGQKAMICTACWVRWAERAGHAPLPRDWRTTSDSLAAWVAANTRAKELVLLKSADLPDGTTFLDAARRQLVDESFPALADCLPRVSWVNLRAPTPLLTAWNWQSPTAGS